jgi:acyl-CoA synthetase (NDP forming)
VTTDLNLPLNKLIDLGNKMDINEVDALSYLAMDPGTKVIAIHLESIEGDGRRFLDLIREASSRGKRVVILRSGRTDAGAKAAASHTGALVRQNHALFDAAVRQYGGIRANGIEEFFDVARAMERFHDLSLKGNRILVGTVSGGEGVIVTDLCGQAGLELPRLEPRTLERLKKELVLPWQIGTNPWDLGVSIQFNGPDKVFTQLMAAVAQDSNVDALALQLPPVASRFPKTFFSAFQPVIEAGKPVALWLAGSEPGRHEVLSWAEEMGVAIFPSPERAIRVLRALHLLTR